MQRTWFLIVTTVSEGITGLLLIALPADLLKLLLGDRAATPEAAFYIRWLGAALFVLSVACWIVRNQHGRPLQLQLLMGAVFYDVVAAVTLACLGLLWGLTGILLWPAVVVHTILAAWGISSLQQSSQVEQGSL